MSDWTTTDLKQRSTAAKQYRGDANIPIGDDTYQLPYRLLESSKQLDVQERIDTTSIAEAKASADDGLDDDVEAAEDKVQELQSKDELTDAEEEELQEAQLTLIQNRGQIMDAMGKGTFHAIHDAGKWAIAPDSEDVNNLMGSTPSELNDRFGDIDEAPTFSGSSITRREIENALEAEMKEVIEGTPFMIFFTLGQQVWEESQNAGNLDDI